MQVTETLSEGLRREFRFLVPAADIDAQVASKLQAIGRQIRLPGFRPGKVPMPVLRQRFGKAALGEVVEETIDQSARKAIEDRGLKPALAPRVDIVQPGGNVDLQFNVAVEVLPEIRPIDFGSLALERLEAEVPEEEVDQMLGRLADATRDAVPVAEGEAAAAGDQVTIDFVGRVDGKEFPGGKAEGYRLDLKEGQFVPGFVGQLEGAKAGETRTVTITFPEDYGAADLAGKTAEFEVTVREVARYAAATIDDEFAKKLGAESLERLRQDMRARIERQYAQVARAHLKRELFDKLAAAHEFPLPEGLVQQEFDTIWREVEARLQGPDADEVREGKSDEELKTEYRDMAARRVRLGLLLAEVGRLNNISVSQEDLGRALQAEAMRYPGQEQQIVEFYRKNPSAMAHLQAPILEDKVVDFILELAKVDVRKVSPEELTKAAEADEKPPAA